MSRVAVCLFFIAIFHTGIITFSQANETSTDGLSKNDVETTTKPTEIEPVKDSEVPSKVETDEKSEVSSKVEPKVEETSDVPEKKDDKPEKKEATNNESKKEDVTEKTVSNDDKPEEKQAKNNESKKENVTEKTVSNDNRKLIPDLLKEAPVEHTKVLFEFPKNILGPVNAVTAKIGEAVSKSIDTAKDLAGGTFNFLRTSAKSIFEN